MQKRKPRTLMIGFDAQKVGAIASIVIGGDGTIRVLNGSGEVELTSGETGLTYQRAKRPKSTVQFFDAPGPPALPHAAVSKFVRVFGVDTNMKWFDGRRLAVSTVTELVTYGVTGSTWSATFQPLWAREFHDVTDQFERVGWHEALLLLYARGYLTGGPVLLVVDAHLEALREIARRQVPVFGDHFLPGNVFLAYASTDNAAESVINRLLAVCDRVSSERMSLSLASSQLAPAVPADSNAPYRFWRHWQIDTRQRFMVVQGPGVRARRNRKRGAPVVGTVAAGQTVFLVVRWRRISLIGFMDNKSGILKYGLVPSKRLRRSAHG